MEEINKIYTSDTANSFSNGAMMGAMLGNNDRNDALTAMLANGGNQQMWNNPFAYLIWLIFAGQFGGFGNNANNCIGDQIQSLQNQIQDNHNSDLTMQAVNGNTGAIAQLSQTLNVGFDQVQSAVNQMTTMMQGGMNNINTSILSQGYQNQLNNCQQTNTILMQSQALQNAVQNGFAQVGFQAERNACDAKETSTQNTQKIIDTLTNHWNLEQQTAIQQLRDEIGRLNQTNALISVLKPSSAVTTTITV